MAIDPRYSDAISGIESGGRYGLFGPVTKSGDRAYGKYQVMGANIPQWTAKFYGQPLTPQQFLANPQAQDAVFSGQFGQYVKKYGQDGAARAWFAGEGGMNNPNAKDMLGTSVQDYAGKFDRAIDAQPLVPGTQAPALPPATTIGAAPTVAQPTSAAPNVQQPQMPAAIPQRTMSPLMALGGGAPWFPQQAAQQMPPPQIQNPIGAMAMFQPPPNTQGLQQLLQNSPALRGLIV